MEFRVEVGALKPTVRTLSRWAQGREYQSFRHAELRAEGDLLRLTSTTQLGTVHLCVDAEVEIEGVVGVNLETLSKFLAPIKGSGWEMKLSFDPDDKVEGRILFVAQLFENGCTRSRYEWPYTDSHAPTQTFIDPQWVAEPLKQSGVIRTYKAPRPLLLQLMQAGLAAHSTVEAGVSELHSAGFTVAGDSAAVFTANSAWAIRAQLWSDSDLEFDTGWEGEPETIAVNAASLQRAMGVVDSFGELGNWLVQIPDSGPIQLSPESAPEEAWVTLPRAADPIDVPGLLDGIRGSRAGGYITKFTGTLALQRNRRAVTTELELLGAYGAVDPNADSLTFVMEKDGLVLEVLSEMHLGASVRIPWVGAPASDVVRTFSGKRLLSALKPMAAIAEPDTTVEVTFWADEESDLERLYLAIESTKGLALDCVLMPMSKRGGDQRLAEFLNKQTEELANV